MLSIMDTLQKKSEIVKEWIFSQNKNVFFWLGIIFGALFLFGVIYQALQKEK